jgi:SAM-dependent methyltransferase
VSLGSTYFDELYAKSNDPWGLATRAYEARKYAVTLAALPRPRYRRGFEPGCSIGVLTRMLATRVDALVAADGSAAALEAARAAGQPDNVEFVRCEVPAEWPDGTFDLLVFSELGYYFSTEDLGQFVDRVGDSLEPDGHLIAVHWRAVVPEYPGTADEVHRALAATRRFTPLAHYEDAHFLLDVFGASGSAAIAGPEE